MAKSVKKKKKVALHEHVWDVFTEEEVYWECGCYGEDGCNCHPPTYTVARCTVKGCDAKLDSYEIADRLNSLHEMSE
jgi:hypothetical protein